MTARSANNFLKPISSKTGVATATPVLCFLVWRLSHQDYTDRYDGRHNTFLNTMWIEKFTSYYQWNVQSLAVECDKKINVDSQKSKH